MSELKPLMPVCPFCGCNITLERRDRIVAIVCPEGSSCRGSGLCTAFKPEDEEKALRQYMQREDGSLLRGARIGLEMAAKAVRATGNYERQANAVRAITDADIMKEISRE